MQIELLPVRSASDNIYRAGFWLRDSTSGIGTVTYIDPESGMFGGLGHGITDSQRMKPIKKSPLRDAVSLSLTMKISLRKLKVSFSPVSSVLKVPRLTTLRMRKSGALLLISITRARAICLFSAMTFQRVISIFPRREAMIWASAKRDTAV